MEKITNRVTLECVDCKYKDICKYKHEHILATKEWCASRGSCIYFEEDNRDDTG